MFDEPLDETLSVRPRNQHRRIDKKRASEEFLSTKKVGERDTLRAFFCDVVKFVCFVGRKNSIAVNELRGFIHSAHVLQYETLINRIQ